MGATDPPVTVALLALQFIFGVVETAKTGETVGGVYFFEGWEEVVEVGVACSALSVHFVYCIVLILANNRIASITVRATTTAAGRTISARTTAGRPIRGLRGRLRS